MKTIRILSKAAARLVRRERFPDELKLTSSGVYNWDRFLSETGLLVNLTRGRKMPFRTTT